MNTIQTRKTEKRKRKSQAREIWHRMRKNKLAMIGLAILIVFLLLAIFADVIVDYDTDALGRGQDRLAGPSAEHWFGTDYLGRDVFARIVYGTRVSLALGLGITVIALSIGGFLGAAAAYYGGIIESVIMRIPSILLTLAIIAALGTSLQNLVIAATIASVPAFTRIIRSYVFTVIGEEYIEAARAGGMNDFQIITSHILPNVIGPIVVEATMNVAGTILSIAGLSFLGMGVQPPQPEWGAMLSDAKDFMMNQPTLVFFPGLAIVLAALSLNLLGDGLRDAIDPRLKD